jgi:hypothetical protein
MKIEKYAVCLFLKDNKIFSLYKDLDLERAKREREAMYVGNGYLEDWRVISMSELKTLLEAGKVDLSLCTKEDQENMLSS